MKLMKIFAPLALGAAVLGLAGCGESPQDLAAKPAIVQQMVENSASICNTGPVHADSAAYSERLSNVLSRVTTANLKTLESHKITVCLDQRLMNQKNGWKDQTVRGVYYQGQDGSGIMTYRDNGMQPSEEGFWHSNPANYYGASAVNKLAYAAQNGQLPGPGGYLTGNVYGSKSHYFAWRAATTEKGALNSNPQLQQPPLKAPAVKPGS